MPHDMMLQRNPLYEAITRGKRLVVLVGNKRALAIAVRQNATEELCTMLTERLRAPALHGGGGTSTRPCRSARSAAARVCGLRRDRAGTEAAQQLH
jgi:hypothetical protein